MLATDVLEHLDDDAAAVAEIQRVLRFGGHALITVPAFPSLWGLQDQVAHHKRRYRQQSLLKLLKDSGLHCERVFHFNYLLFGPIWLARQVIRMSRLRLRSENDVNNRSLNKLLQVTSARRRRPVQQ